MEGDGDMQSLRNGAKFLIALAKWIAIAALAIMTVMIFLQVVYRYVLQDALSFSEELARFMFVWSVAMGSALAWHKGSHIGVEFVVEALPEAFSKPVKLLTSLLSLLFFSILIWYGFQIVGVTIGQLSPALSLSMGLVYLAVPVSGIVMFIDETSNLAEMLFGTANKSSATSGGQK